MKSFSYMRAMSFCILVLAPVHPASGRSFTVDGGGPTTKTAQANARKTAVGKAISLYLPFSTQRADSAKLKECFYSRCADFIAADSLVKEDRMFGLVTQRRVIDVAAGKVRDMLADRGLIDARARKPVIALDVQVEKGDTAQYAVAMASFARALLAEGYRIASLYGKYTQETDAAAAASAFTAGADLLVRASVKLGEPKIENIYGEPMPFLTIELHGRVLQAGSGEVVAARTKSAYRGGLSKLSATEFGLRAGGAELCSLLVADLDGFWRGDGFNHKALRLEFLECGLDSAAPLQARIAAVKAVRAVRLLYTDIRGALLEADCAGSSHDVVAELTRDSTYRAISISPDIVFFARRHAAMQQGSPASTGSYVFSVDTLFPSRAGAYMHDSIAHLEFAATGKGMLRIAARMPDFMTLPATFEIYDTTIDKRRVNLPLALDAAKLLTRNQAGTYYAECSIEGTEGKRTMTVPVRVLGRNDFDWQCPQAIGGFISINDSALKAVAALAQRAIDPVYQGSIDYNVRSAAAAFGYLKSMGIVYVHDPMTTGRTPFDMVQYPRETLVRRAGDCDDLSVLYAALCMTMEIPASLIVYDNHVLVMINTGVPCRNKFAVSADSSLIVEYRGVVWLPVEITALKEGFVKAWITAAADFNGATAEGRNVAIVALDSAIHRFEPITPSGNAPNLDTSKYRGSVGRELSDIRSNNRSLVSKTIATLRKSAGADARALNHIAILEAYRGSYGKAAGMLKKVYADTRSAKIGNNYACALALAGKLHESQCLFDSLCAGGGDHGPVMINRAICLLPLAKDSAQRAAFNVRLDVAIRAFPSADSILEIMGIACGVSLKAADASDGKNIAAVNRQRLRELIIKRKEAQKKNPAPESVDARATMTLSAGVRGADPTDLEKLVTLLYWYDTL